MNNKGFTLIEMLIVIAIIAILSAIVLVGVNGFQSSARDTARIGDLKNIQSYLELYFNKCGYYPGNLGAGGICGTAITATTWPLFVTQMTQTGGITDQFPSDPSSAAGRQFCYGVSSDGMNYILGAQLESPNSVTSNNAPLNGITWGINAGNPACTTASTTYIVGS